MRTGFEQGSSGVPDELAYISGQSPSFSQLDGISSLMNPTSVSTSQCWLTCSTTGVGLRSSGRAENPNKSMGWKSMGLRKHTQACRNSVTLQTSQVTKAPLNKHLKLFRVLVIVSFHQVSQKTFPNCLFMSSERHVEELKEVSV